MSFADEATLESALDYLHQVLVFSSTDWAGDHDSARIYAIVVGWGPSMMASLASKYGWNEETVERLRLFRAAIASAKGFLRHTPAGP